MLFLAIDVACLFLIYLFKNFVFFEENNRVGLFNVVITLITSILYNKNK